jgi:zinc transporter 5/7
VLNCPDAPIVPSNRPPSALIMASTYALPLNPATQTPSHARSHSQYSSEDSTPWTGTMNGSSPLAQNGAANGHRHHRSEVPGQLHNQNLSPYSHSPSHSHDHSHSNGHTHSLSTESTYTLKPFMGGRPQVRPRGESDLGRPNPRKNAGAKFGFSPIHETPPHLPPSS